MSEAEKFRRSKLFYNTYVNKTLPRICDKSCVSNENILHDRIVIEYHPDHSKGIINGDKTSQRRVIPKYINFDKYISFDVCFINMTEYACAYIYVNKISELEKETGISRDVIGKTILANLISNGTYSKRYTFLWKPFICCVLAIGALAWFVAKS